MPAEQNITNVFLGKEAIQGSTINNATSPAKPDEKTGIEIRQMDLLGGIPAMTLFVAGVVQLFASPIKLYKPKLDAFIEWMHDGIEEDFGCVLHSCTSKCHTCQYDANVEFVKKRTLSNIGEEDVVGCIGKELLTADDLVKIIAKKNGSVIIELARLARYPNASELETAIRVIRCIPKHGRSIILWQYINVVFWYVIPRLFKRWIPYPFKALWQFLVAFYMYSQRGLFDGCDSEEGYEIAKLAKLKIISQHTPWIRYGTYYLLMEMGSKHVSVRKWSKDKGAANAKMLFEHVGLAERQLTTLVATDGCSQAQMLYVIALHSIRIMLLYSHVYFASPNILNGSFRKVTLEKGRSQLRVSHCRLDELFGSIYISNDPSSSEANGILWYWYDSLAKQLKSKLGRMLTEQSEMYVYLNIGLADIPSEDLKRVNLALNGGSDGGNSNNPTMANPTENNAGQSKHQINGIEIDNDLYDKLCRYQYILNGKVDEVLERFEATDIFWGPKLWLLRILRIAYKDVKSCENAIGIHDEELKLPEKIRNKARILCFSPFQLMSERPNNKYKLWKHLDQLSGWFGNWDPLGELDTKQGAEQKRPKAHNNDWYSPSMWCICSDNCSGICTLVVNEFKLGISVSQYMKCPYSFYLDDEEAEKRHANKYIRLACASRKEGFRSLGRKIGELEECATGASFDSGIPAEKRIYSIADVIYDSDAATPVVIGESIYRWRENNCNSPDARASDDTLQGISRKLANGYKLVIPPPEIPYKNEADWQSMAAGYAVHISEKKRKELKSKAKKSMIRLPKPERRARTER